ncbi:LuxR family two component transcriptional regulator [Phycicoccus duodecadis]|uniref:LuxR family two component transcriptional regulator n=1 Tax=Phycicoccus duodecadis TaxID=173053 RepID=A0A2N3YME6_9MICO|nr:response regulator transcription factor [Phycicoccus duodecadis]PKW27989.1 LuxR family two component transcriptional regulator [Phycicoccus duodecadis]
MRVVIGEDTALFREGLASLLTDVGHEVVGRASDADELEAVVASTPCDVVVVDVRMPPDHTDDGARAARRIRMRRPDIGILMLSQHVEVRHARDLVALGAFGYLLKDRVLDVEDFLGALERVAAGGSALDPMVVERLMGQRSGAEGLQRITPREREVLGLMAEGRSNTAIAGRLWLTERTVETHVRSILTKLDLADNDDDNRRVLAVLRYLGG